jgi:hypothetical protein
MRDAPKPNIAHGTKTHFRPVLHRVAAADAVPLKNARCFISISLNYELSELQIFEQDTPDAWETFEKS